MWRLEGETSQEILGARSFFWAPFKLGAALT